MQKLKLSIKLIEKKKGGLEPIFWGFPKGKKMVSYKGWALEIWPIPNPLIISVSVLYYNINNSPSPSPPPVTTTTTTTSSSPKKGNLTQTLTSNR